MVCFCARTRLRGYGSSSVVLSVFYSIRGNHFFAFVTFDLQKKMVRWLKVVTLQSQESREKDRKGIHNTPSIGCMTFEGIGGVNVWFGYGGKKQTCAYCLQ